MTLVKIATPCINVCTIGADNLCTGCFRSASEIGYWSAWDNPRRLALMENALPERESTTTALLKGLHPVRHPPLTPAINWADIGPLFEMQGEPEVPTSWREAAVLIPLIAREDGVHVLLTKRTETLRNHSGQVSFPGGARDPGDADIAFTSLREANEETGIPSRKFHVVGYLDRFAVISRYVVTPVVAWLDADYVAQPNPAEVESLFEVPLRHFMDDATYFEHAMEFNGHVRHVGEFVPYAGTPYRVWGATAAMLRMLRHILIANR